VSVPTDIQGGDAVAVQTPSRRNDALSVRTWVAAAALTAFLAQLRELEARRQGEATLEALSPEEFRLRFWSVDRRGHMAVGGLVTKRVHQGEGSPYHHAVEFGFEFDPTLLPRVFAGFQAIAESRG
jgi:hypothetical protein